MTSARLILAIVSTSAIEGTLVVIWRWVLPEFDIELPLAILIAVMAAYAVFAVVDFWFVTRFLKRQATIGLPTMIGSKGKVASPLAPEGMVMIRSELWGASSDGGNIYKGEEIVVTGQDGLKLTVRRSNLEKAAHRSK